jgi:hypothetical protein
VKVRGPGPPTEQADRATIEVRVHEVGQLFNSLDPSPFAERDLDDDAEAYLVGWAREVDSRGPFRILVHLPAVEADKARQRDLGSAIGHYFAYRAGMLERDLSDLFRTGWRSLAIGVAVLAASIALSQAVRTALPDSRARPAGRGGHHDLRLGCELAARRDPALRRLGRATTPRSLPAPRRR